MADKNSLGPAYKAWDVKDKEEKPYKDAVNVLSGDENKSRTTDIETYEVTDEEIAAKKAKKPEKDFFARAPYEAWDIKEESENPYKHAVNIMSGDNSKGRSEGKRITDTTLSEGAYEAELTWRLTDGAERVAEANAKAGKEKKDEKSDANFFSRPAYEAWAPKEEEPKSEKKAAIEANKEQYKKDAALLKEMEENEKKDKSGKMFWREGRPEYPDQLGDFRCSNIMEGPWNAQTEKTFLSADFAARLNPKTQAMYNRYFKAKEDPKGLDSDPTLKKWVEYGDKKADMIREQNAREVRNAPKKGYSDQAHMMHLNGQRGR